MALQFDGSGKVTIPSWQSGSGIWSIRGRAQNTVDRGFIIGSSADSSFSFFTNGTAFEFRYESNNVIHSAALTPGEYYEYEFGFDGSNRYIEVDGVREVFTAHTEILVDFDSIGAYTFSGSKFSGAMVGQVVFTGGSQNRSYDLVNSTGSTLTETVNGQDGTLTGFTTGGFFSLTVNAGSDDTATNGDTVTLSGATASNYDSLSWTCTSGQSPTFSDATALNPDVTFNESGLHVLRLTATNTEGSTFDETEVNVAEAGTGPQPIASFNANELAEDLDTQTSGTVTMGSAAIRHRVQVPNSSEYGWLFRHDAGEYPDSNGNNNEKRFSFDPIEHVWTVRRIYQPDNYYDRFIVYAFSTEALSVTSDWLEGDTVTTTGGTATYVSSKDQSGEAKHFFKDLSAGDWTVFPDGATVTNDRTGGSFTIDRAGFIASNKKNEALWVNDGIHNQGNGGYSQSGMFIESQSVYDSDGSPFFKVDKYSSIPSDEGTARLINELPDTRAPLWDTADNGHFVTFVVERKRSSSANDPTGLMRIWKKVERAGSPYEQMTLVFEATGIQQFHSDTYNGFSAGYLFGASNGGFDEQTDFLLNSFEMYSSRPAILDGVAGGDNMAVYNFTGTNGDRISNDFSFALDGFEIQNNRARPTSTGVGDSNKSVALLAGEADDSISAIVNGRGVATKAFGVCFRMSSDGLNGFGVAIVGSSGQLQLQRFNNSKGPTFTPRTYNIPNYDNSADYKLTAEFTGNDIFVYLDDVEIESMRLTVGDGAYATNTLHGLSGSDSGLAEFDDFAIASKSTSTGPVEPPVVEVIPINTPYTIQGMGRKVTKLGKLFRRPSTMSHPEEYWTRCIHTEGLNNWPSERYPVIMYSSTDHDTGDGGIWVRVYDKQAGSFTDGNSWFEWDDISSRSEFSHITQKTNPITTAGSGQQMETPQPRVMPDGSLRIYFHMQGVEIFGGGPTMQGTKYIGLDNGIDRTQTGIVTETEYNHRYRTGNGHSGYFEVGENTISDIPYADIGTCLQGGGNENINNGQQVVGSNNYTSWDYLAYYRRFNLDLMEFNGVGESDYVYPLDVIQGAKREGNYWRIVGKYRPQSGGGAEAGTRPVEWLVDSKFRAVSAPSFYFPLGASGEFDESEIITPQEFVYDNVVYLFYKTVESDNQSSIGLATVIDEPKTWDIHHPYNDMVNVYESLSNGSTAATGLTYNQTASAKTEAAMSLTSLTMPASGNDATAVSASSFVLADYQHALAEFEYIGKDTGDPVELEFGLVDNLASPASKMSIVFPARVASEQSTLIRCNVLGSTTPVDDTINQYVGQDETADIRNNESVTAKHIFSLRVSPARNELAIMSGSSVVGKFDISGFNYGASMAMFIKARLTDGSQATDETVSFGSLRFKSFNSNVVNLISAPTITTSKTTDSVTVSTNSVAGATSYKYYLNGIEQSSGTFTDLEPETTYTVYARASNALGDSAPSTIQTVTTDAAVVANQPPVANAGTNQSVAAGATVTLDGTGSTDSDGTIVSYAWTQTAGDAVTLTGANTATPSFTAPSTNAQQTLTFELTVTDDGGLTATGSVDVQVAAQSLRPFFINNSRNFSFIDSDGLWTDKLRVTETDSYTLTIDPNWISPETITSYSVTPKDGLTVVAHAREDNVIQVYLTADVVGRTNVRFDFETATRSDHVVVSLDVIS